MGQDVREGGPETPSPVATAPAAPPAEDAASGAIRRYEERLARDPYSMAWAPLADAYRKAGRARDAIELCRDGLARFPQYHTARLILAKAHLDEGDAAAALSVLEAVREAGVRDAEAYRLAGELYRRAGRLDEAVERLAEAVRLDPSDREARLTLESLEAQGRVPGHSPLAAVLADDTFATLTFGALCLEQGLAEEAAQVFLRRLRTYPEDARARDGLDQALRVKTQKRKGS